MFFYVFLDCSTSSQQLWIKRHPTGPLRVHCGSAIADPGSLDLGHGMRRQWSVPTEIIRTKVDIKISIDIDIS